MNKRQLINAILQLNCTTSAQFLDQFEETDLSEYLSLLQDMSHRQKRPAAAPDHAVRMAS